MVTQDTDAPELPGWIMRSMAAREALDLSTLRGQITDWLSIMREQHRDMAGGHTFPYIDPGDFVLEEGEWFEASQRDERRFPKRPDKYCFINAWRLAQRHPRELTYVEGYAHGVITVHHAWTVMANGTVVDPTWDWGDDIHPLGEQGLVGVRFSHDIMRLHHSLRRAEASVLQLYQYDYPVLQDRPYDPEKLRARYEALVTAERSMQPIPRKRGQR